MSEQTYKRELLVTARATEQAKYKNAFPLTLGAIVDMASMILAMGGEPRFQRTEYGWQVRMDNQLIFMLFDEEIPNPVQKLYWIVKLMKAPSPAVRCKKCFQPFLYPNGWEAEKHKGQECCGNCS